MQPKGSFGLGNPEKEPGDFWKGITFEVTLTHKEDMVFTQLNMCFILVNVQNVFEW